MFMAWWHFVSLGEDADGGLVRASLRGQASPGTGTRVWSGIWPCVPEARVTYREGQGEGHVLGKCVCGRKGGKHSEAGLEQGGGQGREVPECGLP